MFARGPSCAWVFSEHQKKSAETHVVSNQGTTETAMMMGSRGLAPAAAGLVAAVLTLSTSNADAATKNCFWMCTCLAGYGGHTDCCPKRICTSSGSKAFGSTGVAVPNQTPAKTLSPLHTPVAPVKG
jgi:hypothetical protein